LAALLALQCGLLLGGGLVIAAVRSWKRHSRLDDLTLTDQRLLRQLRLDRLIAAALLAMPLIMPFYFDYDLILLAIPATLLAREAMLCRARGWTGSGQGTRGTGLWTALFVCLMINAPLGAAMRVNVAVPLLAALALGAIVRAQ